MHGAGRHGWSLHLHRRVPLIQELRIQAHELRVGGGRVGAGQRGAREQRPLEARQARAAVERGAAPQLARGAADEHVLGRRVQHPVVALAGVVVVPRHLHKALVQTQVVPDGVLPALPVLSVVREVGHDVLVDAVQREPLLGAVPDGHHDERVVAVGGFLVLLVLLVIVLGLGAVDGLGARHVQLGVAEVGLGGRGARRRGRGRRRGRRLVHQYRINTEISFELHHFGNTCDTLVKHVMRALTLRAASELAAAEAAHDFIRRVGGRAPTAL